MALTYDAIATLRVTAQVNTVTFTNIPQTFTDLRLVYTVIATASGGFYVRFNSDTGANYSNSWVQTNSGSSGSGQALNQTSLSGSNGAVAANIVAGHSLDIFNYRTGFNKQTLCIKNSARPNAGGQFVYEAGLWRNNAAVSSITIDTDFNMAAGSTFAIYGILRA